MVNLVSYLVLKDIFFNFAELGLYIVILKTTDTLAPFLFVVCLDYVLRTSVDKISNFGLTLTKARGCRYPATTIIDADYADDLALISDTIAEAEDLLHTLERAADVRLYVNAGKTEFMCSNQEGSMKTVCSQ